MGTYLHLANEYSIIILEKPYLGCLNLNLINCNAFKKFLGDTLLRIRCSHFLCQHLHLFRHFFDSIAYSR